MCVCVEVLSSRNGWLRVEDGRGGEGRESYAACMRVPTSSTDGARLGLLESAHVAGQSARCASEPLRIHAHNIALVVAQGCKAAL